MLVTQEKLKFAWSNCLYARPIKVVSVGYYWEKFLKIRILEIAKQLLSNF